MDDSVVDSIKSVLEKVRPFLQNDGGDIEFVDYKDGIVYVNVLGACIGCTALGDTIKDGIEMILMEEVPGVIGVEVVNSPIENLEKE